MQIRVILAEEDLLNNSQKPEDGDIVVNPRYAFMTQNTFDVLPNIKQVGFTKLEVKRNVMNIMEHLVFPNIKWYLIVTNKNKVTTELEIIIYKPKTNNMKNDEIVSTTKEKVLKAAKNNAVIVTRLLQELFPEVFKDEEYFNLRELSDNLIIFDHQKSKDAGFSGNEFMQIRNSGEYEGRAFYLSDEYDWQLKTDNDDSFCLIPTKKQ
jgi:hypothetical protein